MSHPADPVGVPRVGALRRVLGRLSGTGHRPPLPVPEAPREGVDQIATAPMRVRVTLQGSIQRVTINPRGVNRWLEAVLDDGTGEVVLIWMGRRLVRGIDAGRNLEVSGSITLFEGRRAIYNPNYSLLT